MTPATRDVYLYNTLSRSKELFKPITPGKVLLYCCGPTVYSFPHVGNMRAYTFEDVLARTLRLAGYQVQHVMNITDVGHLTNDSEDGEDKMLIAAKREGKKSFQIADFYTDIFFQESALLNIRRPDIVCKASEHIAQMLALIQRLEKNGCAYVSHGNVYFDTSSISDYGKLARLKLEDQIGGSRIEVDPAKKNPNDFVLWFTNSKFENQELQWDSPWGRGYPGWHIECSAMAMHYLGEKIDIHCGGIDHVPVHHTNEIAQSEGATRSPWVHYWMHGEFLVMDNVKISKSLGHILRVSELANDQIEPIAYRMLILGTHYRQQLNWSIDAVRAAYQGLKRLRDDVYEIRQQVPCRTEELLTRSTIQREAIVQALTDDLGTPRALGILHETLADRSVSPEDKLIASTAADAVFGLDLLDWQPEQLVIPNEVQLLADERQQARNAREWKRSDELRAQIMALGFEIDDSKGGQTLKKR